MEYQIFTTPKTMSLDEQVVEVSKQVMKWISSLKKPFNIETDKLCLRKCERNGKENVYHYQILRNRSKSLSHDPVKSDIQEFTMDC